MNRDQWARIKELFHAALEHAPGERPAFLQNACRGNEAIRIEVERLLTAHSEAGSFIEQPALSGEAPVAIPMTGRVMGHYEVSRLIGTGGMGSVYAARDVELGRVVALKVVTDHDIGAQGRLRREAQRASQLNHPHICTIYEVGAAEGQTFFAMEYVEGQTLSERIAEKSLPLEVVLRHAIQIADALSHAHQHGVIHRDLKSANVMVGADGRAKVLDFGLACDIPAKRVNEFSQSKAALAGEGLIAGTLPYMAPELLRGQAADVQSDVWALGVVLYEMATGQRPFDAETGFELSAGILHQAPAPFRDHVPVSLQDIIRRCLAKDRHDRYAQASDVRSALEVVKSSLATGSSSELVSGAPRRLLNRRTTAVVLSGVAAVVVALGAMWLWMRPARVPVGVGASGRPAVAVMAFDNMAGAQDTAWLSKGVPTMLLTGLAQTRGLDIVSARRLQEALDQLGERSLESLDQVQVADVARRAGAGAMVVGSIAKSGSELRIDAQLEDLSTGRVVLAATVRGTDVFALVDQLAGRIREGVGFQGVTDVRRIADVSSSSLEAYRLYSQGFDAYINHRWNDAQKLLEEAVAIDPGFAEAYLYLASVNYLNGRPAASRDNLQQAAGHSDRLNERQRLLMGLELARQTGNGADAARRLDELVAKFPDSDDAYGIACRLYCPFGLINDPAKSLRILARGVAARPSSLITRNDYGYALLWAGQYGDATREFETYARVAAREPNPYDSLGEANLVMGLPEKALEYYSRALTVDPSFPFSHNGRAWTLATLGRYEEAIADDPPDAFVKAFILSRTGRYADAARIISAGLREAEVNGNMLAQGNLSLLLSLFALERREYPIAREELRRAEQYFAPMTVGEQRPYLVALRMLAGMVETGAGRLAAARSDLEALKHRYDPTLETENWWSRALEGDIALAEGRLQEAADAYAAGEPNGKMWFNMLESPGSILANNLLSRDGPARVDKARGNLARAIESYRRLTSVDTRQQWIAVLEPRYILEIARLLDQTGDKRAAILEYRRFLDLWKHADADVPELAEARRAVARINQSSSATR